MENNHIVEQIFQSSFNLAAMIKVICYKLNYQCHHCYILSTKRGSYSFTSTILTYSTTILTKDHSIISLRNHLRLHILLPRTTQHISHLPAMYTTKFVSYLLTTWIICFPWLYGKIEAKVANISYWIWYYLVDADLKSRMQPK